jgi:hypothetical protein
MVRRCSQIAGISGCKWTCIDHAEMPAQVEVFRVDPMTVRIAVRHDEGGQLTQRAALLCRSGPWAFASGVVRPA